MRTLLADIEKEPHALVQYARESFASVPQVREDLSWQGVPWRWCFTYHAAADEPRPFAYLIPQPTKPAIAVPIEADIIAELPLRRLPKHIRDVLGTAPNVGGVRWCQWDLASKNQIDDVLKLARLKLPDEGEP